MPPPHGTLVAGAAERSLLDDYGSNFNWSCTSPTKAMYVREWIQEDVITELNVMFLLCDFYVFRVFLTILLYHIQIVLNVD